ncbi:MAG: hypothetical protein QM765_13310 [Myxococcales bacterium]
MGEGCGVGEGLWMLGVVHRDPEGEARLLAWLRKLAPRAVGLELSAPSVRLRRERGEALRAKLVAALRGCARGDLADEVAAGRRPAGVAGDLVAALEVPFELLAAEAYSRESGARLALLDDPVAAAEAVALFETEVLERPNVALLLEQEAKVGRAFDPFFEQYALARRYFADPSLFRYHFGATEAEAMASRDAHVARGLEGLCAQHGRVAYVAGWEHLVDGGLKTIWPAFKDRGAQRRLISAEPADEP